MSASPSTVTDIEVLALGASIITRIQTSLALGRGEPGRGRDHAGLALHAALAPLATTVVTSLAAIELRDGLAGRVAARDRRGAATTLERSTGEAAAGA